MEVAPALLLHGILVVSLWAWRSVCVDRSKEGATSVLSGIPSRANVHTLASPHGVVKRMRRCGKEETGWMAGGTV